MSDTKYNGWTNYATWRVNLELFDGYVDNFEDVYETYEDDLSALADRLEEEANEAITGYGEIREDSLAVSYAQAFLSDVNWYEIAESILNDAKELAEDNE